MLRAMLEAGVLKDAAVATGTGRARFGSIREWVQIDVRGRTLADMIDDTGFEAPVAAAERKLSALWGAGLSVSFPAPDHIVFWSRAESLDINWIKSRRSRVFGP